MYDSSKLVFETIKGSRYYRNLDGFWRREKFNGKAYDGWVYIGSINPQENKAIDNELYDKQFIIKQLAKGSIDGFVDRFIVGFHPIGLFGCNPSDHSYINGKLIRTKPLKVDIHIGHRIIRVY